MTIGDRLTLSGYLALVYLMIWTLSAEYVNGRLRPLSFQLILFVNWAYIPVVFYYAGERAEPTSASGYD